MATQPNSNSNHNSNHNHNHIINNNNNNNNNNIINPHSHPSASSNSNSNLNSDQLVDQLDRLTIQRKQQKKKHPKYAPLPPNAIPSASSSSNPSYYAFLNSTPASHVPHHHYSTMPSPPIATFSPSAASVDTTAPPIVPAPSTPVKSSSTISNSQSSAAYSSAPSSSDKYRTPRQKKKDNQRPAQQTPASARTPPVTPLSPSTYFAPSLRSHDAEGYRAAGILAFKFHHTPATDSHPPLVEVYFLFGRCKAVLTTLGGKVEKLADKFGAIDTAAREFFEESCGTLDSIEAFRQRVESQQRGVLWYSSGKFALFTYELTTPTELRLPEAHAEVLRQRANDDAFVHPDYSEMADLHWVEGSELQRFLTKQRNEPKYECRTTTGERHQFERFACHMIRSPQIQRTIKELLKEAKLRTERLSENVKTNLDSKANTPAAAEEAANPDSLETKNDETTQWSTRSS